MGSYIFHFLYYYPHAHTCIHNHKNHNNIVPKLLQVLGFRICREREKER